MPVVHTVSSRTLNSRYPNKMFRGLAHLREPLEGAQTADAVACSAGQMSAPLPDAAPSIWHTLTLSTSWKLALGSL